MDVEGCASIPNSCERPLYCGTYSIGGVDVTSACVVKALCGYYTTWNDQKVLVTCGAMKNYIAAFVTAGLAAYYLIWKNLKKGLNMVYI